MRSSLPVWTQPQQQTRRSLHQQVTVRQQGDEHALHQDFLSQYPLLDPDLQCFDFFERRQWLDR